MQNAFGKQQIGQLNHRRTARIADDVLDVAGTECVHCGDQGCQVGVRQVMKGAVQEMLDEGKACVFFWQLQTQDAIKPSKNSRIQRLNAICGAYPEHFF